MAITYEAVPANEYVSHIDVEQLGNQTLFSVVSGCTVSESAANMVVTVASGVVLVNGASVVVAGGTLTLVSDPSNKRWCYATVNAAGAATVVVGDPATSGAVEPTKPDPSGKVILKMYKVEAGQTIAANVSVAPNKRILATTTAGSVLTSTGDVLYASAPNTPARLAKGTARQELGMNAAGTLPAWQASSASLMTTTGDILIASGANTPARLAAAADGLVLTSTGAGSAPAWEAVVAGPTLVRKSSDQSVDNSATLVNDSQLVFAMEANSHYLIQMMLVVRTYGTGKMKHLPVVPSGATWMLNAGPGGATYASGQYYWGTEGFTAVAQNIYQPFAGLQATFNLFGYVTTAGAAGNFQWQFAQTTATASEPATMSVNSFIKWEKVA